MTGLQNVPRSRNTHFLIEIFLGGVLPGNFVKTPKRQCPPWEAFQHGLVSLISGSR